MHAYGLMLLLGIIAATWLTGRRYTGRWAFWSDPRGDPSSASPCGASSAGSSGAIYHVVTSWSIVDEEWWEPFAVWEGGLGVWGGSPAASSWAPGWSSAPARACSPSWTWSRRGCSSRRIGRWGNYFNQELYGEPTDLPWGLEIDWRTGPSSTRIPLFSDTTFHPTFLYESLWCLLGVGVLLLIDKRVNLGRRASSASTSSGTASAASGWSCCGSTRPTSSSGSA